jgi:predicted nucleotide-binding protein
MAKYNGNLEELKSALSTINVNGTWAKMIGGHRFTTNDGASLTFYNTGTLLNQGKGTSKLKIQAFIDELDSGLPIKIASEATQMPSVIGNAEKAEVVPELFIVYGHDDASRDQLELALNKMNIKHFILAKEGGEGLTIIELLEQKVGQKGNAHAGIVLLTPDDKGYAIRDGEDAIKERARQNVILEMGMLISKLGRKNTIILVKGKIERPSDTDGIIYIQFQNNIKEVIAPLVARLEKSGFKIDHTKLIDALK